ncbi:Na+/melibiose symporter and related transporters [Serpentinimonas maccroryi]|uniref:Na+/melibiose symporter and related transporters n=1 Tax=Serpentinimonas maccroryi TaxID=1458426 RepID=A0A060NXH9_9BURK|nr:hypothetical protein [Serpentinimonas maccroryi]MBA4252997.1 hypothetical protein [Comamonadaceae bacterium]BAO84243.1 Na+/melibiose symporter and related transporters [Serpentinimonas maccroryi]
MMVVRILIFMLLGASALSFVLYLVTGQQKYRRWGFALFKWTMLAIVVFFGVLFVSQFDWSLSG